MKQLLLLVFLVASALAVFPFADQFNNLRPSQKSSSQRGHAARDYTFPILSCPQAPQPVTPLPSKYQTRVKATLQDVETSLNQLLSKTGVPGVAVSVTVDQKVIWAKGLGYANKTSKEAPHPDMPFRIGSISKVFVALAMMQARDKGLIHLDEEINVKFPNFQIKNAFPTDRSITYRELASHMAALPRSSPCIGLWGDCNYTNDQIFSRLKDQHLIQPIDDMPSYSNLGFALLGHLIADMHGTTWDDYLQQNILNPLGMTNTGMRVTPQVAEEFAVGYLFGSDTPAPLYDLGWESPAGGMYSTVNDLAKLLSFLFRQNLSQNSIPSQILDGDTIKEWLLPVWVSGILEDEMMYGFGIPWEMSLLPNDPFGRRYWHRGKGGAVFGFTSEIIAIPELKLGVAVLLNGGLGGPAGQFADSAVAKLIPLLYQIYSENQPAPPLPADPQAYVGKYHGSGSNWPFFLTELNATIALTKDTQSHTRLRLTLAAYSGGHQVMQGENYLNWVPALNAFELMSAQSECRFELGGGRQLVTFDSTRTSFSEPGLWYGITFTKVSTE